MKIQSSEDPVSKSKRNKKTIEVISGKGMGQCGRIMEGMNQTRV
jgi:hypothetical protein